MHFSTSKYILVHLSSLEAHSDQSEACLDDYRGFVDGMVIIGHGSSKSIFSANNVKIVLSDSRCNQVDLTGREISYSIL